MLAGDETPELDGQYVFSGYVYSNRVAIQSVHQSLRHVQLQSSLSPPIAAQIKAWIVSNVGTISSLMPCQKKQSVPSHEPMLSVSEIDLVWWLTLDGQVIVISLVIPHILGIGIQTKKDDVFTAALEIASALVGMIMCAVHVFMRF